MRALATYAIKEVFGTLQGEGLRAGARSVFVRMAGCNLWSGRGEDRATGKGPCARWCDTDFFKGTTFELPALLDRMAGEWGSAGDRWCVITGGEPGLQIDDALVDALHGAGWHIAVETNGTVDTPALRRCDHLCVSPKRGTSWWTLGHAHELKVILPGAVAGEAGWQPDELLAIEARAADAGAVLFVQPQDPLVTPSFVEQTYLKRSVDAPPALAATFRAHLQQCIDWVASHPRWRLSVQLHKYIGIA
jgi:organic radical activating enzyme